MSGHTEGMGRAKESTTAATRPTVWATDFTVWATEKTVAQTVNGLLGPKKGPREGGLRICYCKDNTKTAKMQIALRGYVSEEKCVAEGEFSINCCPVMVLTVVWRQLTSPHIATIYRTAMILAGYRASAPSSSSSSERLRSSSGRLKASGRRRPFSSKRP